MQQVSLRNTMNNTFYKHIKENTQLMCKSNTILSRQQKECLKIINTLNNKSTQDDTKSDSPEKNGMAKNDRNVH